MFSSLSHEGLCTLIADLDFVLERRQLRLSSSAYDIPDAAHPSDWPLENVKAEEKEGAPQTKFQFDLNVPESSLSQLPSPMDNGANGHIEPPKLASEQSIPEPRTRSQLVFDIVTRRNQKPVQSPCPEEDTCRTTLGIFGDSCTGKSQLLVQCPCPPTIETVSLEASMTVR
ncbi:hypothetical protein K440DRAFT_251341 [Wilcoxina mikolae CBS 423.85]|nr:hypothetical protein K440DRAFT_251341 [Wilcoxina mikolae CBS 423.85]